MFCGCLFQLLFSNLVSLTGARRRGREEKLRHESKEQQSEKDEGHALSEAVVENIKLRNKEGFSDEKKNMAI